jgi:uncharacterized membrane protein
VRVFVSAESLALRCELKGLCARRVDLVFVVGGLVITVAARGFIVYEGVVSVKLMIKNN